MTPIAAAEGSEAAPQVLQGPMEVILYGGAGAGTARAGVVAAALKLFAHKLDLTRDLALGDTVRLVTSQHPTIDGSGRTEALDYAEVDGARGRLRFYRVQEGGEDADAFTDDNGASLRNLLLRTPLAHPRLTSTFGLRRHPLLGYTRMHRGVDFGAAVGTPVLAAGDGVVEFAGWAGGYGRLVRVRHIGGLKTAYAHLSAWPSEVRPGAVVRQGQVLAWTGASGLATGPHLHFEVIRNGAAVDPATVELIAPPPSAIRMAALETRRRSVESLLADAGGSSQRAAER